VAEKRREKSQMIGDGLRETSVLVLVFYALDTAIKEGPFDWSNFSVVATVAIGVFYLGMILEGRDEL
jgi:hypothetical protein